MGVILHKKQNYSGVSPYKYVPITTENYKALPQSEIMDSTKIYFLIDAKVASARIDDTDTSTGKVWSSKKVSDEVDTINSKFGLKEIHRTTNANQTYAVKLADLKTYYDALTTEKKIKAIIVQNDLNIYKPITLTGNFSYQGASTTTSSISAINLSNTTLVGWAYKTTGNTMSDYTNQSSTDVFVLYVID